MINGDQALRGILRRLSHQTRNVACPEIQRIMLSDGCRLTDKGMELIARRCPVLTHLQIQMSFDVSQNALVHLVSKCTNLQHLDVSGELTAHFIDNFLMEKLILNSYFSAFCSTFQDAHKFVALISTETYIRRVDCSCNSLT